MERLLIRWMGPLRAGGFRFPLGDYRWLEKSRIAFRSRRGSMPLPQVSTSTIAPVEHYSHARIAAKRKALENMGKDGRNTVTTQNLLFRENDGAQMIENNGGRDRGRTGDRIVANDAKKFIRRGAATTYVF
jgi:hypothetical protein